MATGATKKYWEDERLPGVLKLKLLQQYLPLVLIRLSKPGSRSVYIDSYAGRGTYDTGAVGSSGMMLDFAVGQKFGASKNRIDLFFCEKNAEWFKHLDELADKYRAKGITVVTQNGDAEHFLPDAVSTSQGLPAFIFLDPCGLSVPFEQIVQCLNRSTGKWPPTELLLNFSMEAVRRIGGHISSVNRNPKTVENLDRALGGTWWHTYFENGVTDDAVLSVVDEFARRLGTETKCTVVSVPVYRKPGHKPVYYLVFATRNSGGLWNFGDKVARATEAWWRAAADAEGGLDVYPRIEDIEEEAVDQIAENIARIVADKGAFQLVDYTIDVFGEYYGRVREMVARKAVKALFKSGRISSNGVREKTEKIHVNP